MGGHAAGEVAVEVELRHGLAAALHAATHCMRVLDDAVQIHGGYGYMWETEVNRLYRAGKLLEIGAGTMHPDTFFRVLGPEPYRVAYVQPSRRPADARYGENPFRLGRHGLLAGDVRFCIAE